MPDIPTLPQSNDGDDSQQPLQGYQDDFDTSERDQFAEETGSQPYQDTPATRSELREGLRDTEGADQEGGSTEPNDETATQDDFREEVEGRDQDAGDDKNRDLERW